MIPVNEAKQVIRNNCGTLSPIIMPLQQAAGLVLAKDVYAMADIPAFDQSAMDGYAFCFNDYQTSQILKIEGNIPAGHDQLVSIQPLQAARIFTGAAVPGGADTVVMQEKTIVENNELIIQDAEIIKGSNIRSRGTEITAGALALTQNDLLTPAAIGFLSGIGVTEVTVYPKPSVSIIVTGKEIQQPGVSLQYGQVYDSNSFTLRAALHQLHITSIKVIWVDDDLLLLQQALSSAIDNSDMVLLTGGVSVGDYDYVLQAAALSSVSTLFHKVKQKPGKPLYVGKKERKVIFGLPGNPSSVLTCFYEYVIPALEQLTMQKNITSIQHLPLAAAYSKKAGLTHFIKARYKDGKVMPLQAQESYRLSSFAIAECLICLEENGTEYAAGDMVEVHFLPV